MIMDRNLMKVNRLTKEYENEMIQPLDFEREKHS